MEPDKYPMPPKKPVNGYKIFGKEKKDAYLKILPESQQNDIAVQVRREWTNAVTTEDMA